MDFNSQIKNKSVIELKAMAYDFGLVINDYKQMLNMVNQEIIQRAHEELKKQDSGEDTKVDSVP